MAEQVMNAPRVSVRASSLLTKVFAVVALLLLGMGTYFGLVLAPAESYMGEVYRIIYVHVPSVWMTLVAYVVAFVAAVIYLFKGSIKADAVSEASTEVGLFFNGLGLLTGSIWAKPTWGVWWSWDPRLTTFAILFFAYAGYLALRRFVDNPDKRATWAAVANVIIAVDIPIVWFSVKWWNSLHQVQSSPSTMEGMMVTALRVNAFAFLALYLSFLMARYGIARLHQAAEQTEPPMPPEASS